MSHRHARVVRTGVLLFVTSALLSCVGAPPDLGDSSPPGTLSAPLRLDFPPTAVGDTTDLALLVTASGRDVWVQGLQFDTPGFELDSGDTGLSSFWVDADDPLELTIRFRPHHAGEHTATALLHHASGLLAVSLTGHGQLGELDAPDAIEFGQAPVACPRSHTLALENTGDAALELTAATDHLAFTVPEPDVQIGPGESAELEVVWTPTAAEAQAGTLTLGGHTIALAGTGLDDRLAETWTWPGPTRDVLVAVDTLDDSGADELHLALDEVLASPADLRFAVVVADDGCIAGSPSWIDASTADPHAALSEQLCEDCPTATSGTFSRMEATLTDPSACNDLWQRDAELALVGVVDGPERSVNPYTYWVSLFQSQRTWSDQVVIHGVGGDYPAGCGETSASTGLYEATVATGGTLHSICAPWGVALGQDLASVARPSRVLLAETPEDGSLVVAVGGTPTTDFTVDQQALELGTAPFPGTSVTATYRPLDVCD